MAARRVEPPTADESHLSYNFSGERQKDIKSKSKGRQKRPPFSHTFFPNIVGVDLPCLSVYLSTYLFAATSEIAYLPPLLLDCTGLVGNGMGWDGVGWGGMGGERECPGTYG